ncbi:MAG: DegT/DnrJ/EryC1/StrS family aminotransferase [Caldilineaceae bacterium]
MGAGIHYPVPLHLQPAYAQFRLPARELPVTEEIAASCLSLPLYPEMTVAQQEYVADLIYQFFNRSKFTILLMPLLPPETSSSDSIAQKIQLVLWSRRAMRKALLRKL